MAETMEDSSPVGRRWNPVVVTVALLLLAPVAPLVLPFILLAGMFVLSLILPGGGPTASTRISDLDTDLTLRFYSSWDEDSGRYLYVHTPRGKTRINMALYDWVHNARTSVYLTAERKIAVLGPMGMDYLVSLDPLTTTRVAAGASENWTYLGAFDFPLADDGGRSFRFVSAAEQAECIPMLSEGPYQTYKVRTSARQRNCNHFYVKPVAK
jgi:hypothetical protein